MSTRRILETQDVDNRRVFAGDPNGNVYGEPGWTCQDWTNGLLYVKSPTGGNGVTGWEPTATGSSIPSGGIDGQVITSLGGNLVWSFALGDSSLNTSIDWDFRLLSDGVADSVNWSFRELYNGIGDTSVAWDDGTLIDVASGIAVVDWFSLRLSDTAAISSVEWADRLLVEFSSSTTLDWGSGMLVSPSSGVTANWFAMQLYDFGGEYSIDWNVRILRDAGGTPSFDWEGRVALDTLGSNALAWGGSVVQMLKPLRLGNAAVAGAVAPTHTITLQDSTGTTYRVPCLV